MLVQHFLRASRGRSDSISAWFLPQFDTFFFSFFFFKSPSPCVISLISFTYTTTWYKKRKTNPTQTQHVQLLTNAVEMHKPARKTPLCSGEGNTWSAHLSKTADDACFGWRRRRRSSLHAMDCKPCFLAPTSLEINQTDQKNIQQKKK